MTLTMPSKSNLRLSVATAIALCLLVAGCGDSKVKVKGQVTRDGQPVKGGMHILFYPIDSGKDTQVNAYPANVRADGSYEVLGRQGKGIPPGKYRIEFRGISRSDPLPGSPESPKLRRSEPIVREVTSDRAVIDIDLAELKPE